MRRLSTFSVYGSATTTLVFLASAVQMLEEKLSEKSIFQQDIYSSILYLVANSLGYFVYFRLCCWVLNRHRFRDWRGDWFYHSAPDPKAKIRDGGFAWVRFYINENELAYRVIRYGTYAELEHAYEMRRGIWPKIRELFRSLSIFGRTDAGGRQARAHMNVSAYSETIKFDHENNSLVVFYHVKFTDPQHRDRKGRLELELEGHHESDLAIGKFTSVPADVDSHVLSHGEIRAYRRMSELREHDRTLTAIPIQESLPGLRK